MIVGYRDPGKAVRAIEKLNRRDFLTGTTVRLRVVLSILFIAMVKERKWVEGEQKQ